MANPDTLTRLGKQDTGQRQKKTQHRKDEHMDTTKIWG
jgi:hypothetical protein